MSLTVDTPKKPNPFAPVSMDAVPVEIPKPVYVHGFTDQEVEEIKKVYIELEKRDKNIQPLTLEEQTIVFKHFRITRTEVFILNPPKVKKPPKEKKPKAEKKLTKKLQTKLDQLAFLIEQEIITEETMKEEDMFFWIENKHRIIEVK